LAEGEALNKKEWLKCTDPMAMLEFLQGKASTRKLQLFVCAACRRLWPLLEEESLRNAVEISEQYADGTVGGDELARAAAAALPLVRPLPKDAPGYHAAWAAAWSTLPANRYFADNASAYLLYGSWGIGKYLLKVLGIVTARRERVSQVGLLREIFGNPFQPVALDPTWLTPTVKALARAIYEEHNFTDLPVLADALEEAGCISQDILSHLRGPGEHTRGCWAVDIILGKVEGHERHPGGSVE
jgi:hypothetical protein